eukprot:scaffold110887_cov30-Phaeocystis_antarctica.AAC.1
MKVRVRAVPVTSRGEWRGVGEHVSKGAVACSTTLHHYPAPLPCTTTLHHYPVPLPCTTTLHHYPAPLP